MSLTLPLITRGPPSGLPPLGAATALRVWQFAPVVSAVLVVLAAAYLAGVYRVRRRHPARPWPAGRAAAFLAGLGVIAIATQSSIGAYDDVLFSVHMIQHLLLIMVAPPLLVLGRPVTLLLHSAGNPVHTWVKRAVRSRVASALTWPPAATALYCAVVAGTHLTPLMNLVLENSAVHDAEHALYLLTGYLFFLPVLGSEPIRWRPPPAGRYLMLLLVMPVDTAVGVLLMLAPREWFPAYARTGRAWGPGLLADLHDGGMIMWIGSDIIMTVLAVAVAAAVIHGRRQAGQLGRWVEGIRRTGLLRALDTTGVPAPAAGRAGPDARAIDDDAHLAAYNAYLSALDTGPPGPRQGP
jgi:putative copper resistance protein D